MVLTGLARKASAINRRARCAPVTNRVINDGIQAGNPCNRAGSDEAAQQTVNLLRCGVGKIEIHNFA
jgi:hypothetical protein